MSPPGERGALLLENGPVRIKRARHGLIAYPWHDQFVGRSVELYGEWSPGDAAIVAPYLRPGATVLDVGANVGVFTLFLAGAVGRGGQVLAFEPVPALHRLLVTNLALNGLDQVTPDPRAVGRNAGQALVPALDLGVEGNFGAAALGTGGATVPVEVVAIDDLGLERCALIKADVEGHEIDVIEGALDTIERCRPVLFLENEEPTLSPALIARLLELDYRLWWHAPTLYRSDNWFGAAENVFPGLGSLNLLGLPTERPDIPRGLTPVAGPADWPAWWPDWAAQ